ncbi:MAG: DUF4292 domain-containing protein [Deltaproteobacteria bacterium]|nr:DUF4292 domain-containing protein [Deltaproteobacteria bacterium]
MRIVTSVLAVLAAMAALACGPVPRPKDAYDSAPDLLADMRALRDEIESFRITGTVDHFGEEHRVQGKTYLFAELPGRLRVDLLSPFGNTLSVLTVDQDVFALADFRENRFLEGPAEPCNIARLIRLPLPADDVIRVLIGHSPIIDGHEQVSWDRQGFYRVTISDGARVQTLEVEPDRSSLKLRRSRLEEGDQVIFDMTFERWRVVDRAFVPHEIRVVMPRDKADLLVRYDEDGVEINVDLPKDAWTQSFPAGADVERVECR